MSFISLFFMPFIFPSGRPGWITNSFFIFLDLFIYWTPSLLVSTFILLFLHTILWLEIKNLQDGANLMVVQHFLIREFSFGILGLFLILAPSGFYWKQLLWRKVLANERRVQTWRDGVKLMNEVTDEPTWRCHQNPFIGALGIQEPVIPGEPLIKG